MSADDKRIREFAYQIWESEGKPTGQEERHWEMARKLAEAEALAPTKTSSRKPAAAKPSVPKTNSKANPETKPATKAVAKPAPAAAATKPAADKKPRAAKKPPAS
ncbi:hypothetical protein D9M71_205800 [compost metagenome]